MCKKQNYEEKLAHYMEWVKPGKTLEEMAISELESLLSYFESQIFFFLKTRVN